MSEGICDFRFAICDWALRSIASRRFSDSSSEPKPFSLTPRFSGVWESHRSQNRFSGFQGIVQTAKAVLVVGQRTITPLKRGVNETDCSGASSQSQI